MQRFTSIVNQQRCCREGAEHNGWTPLEDSFFYDEACSGQVLAGRDEFLRMIDLVVNGVARFAGIVIDDTSRFGRNLTEALQMIDMITYAGIFVYFVNRDLDSRNPNFKQLFILYAQQDEQYSLQISRKVYEGQKGRVLDGKLAQGRIYGYDNIVVYDETKRGRTGLAGVAYVDLAVFEPEAKIVRHIYRECAMGISPNRIAADLRKEDVPSARSRINERPGRWLGQTVKRIIANEKYKGTYVWGKTRLVRNPHKHKKVQQARPRSEWIVSQIENWRIVTDEEWDAAQRAIAKRREKHSGNKLGGLSRSEKAKSYLFSGLLLCGDCGGNLIIFSNRKDAERYMCGRALRNDGSCNNRTSIHQRILQSRLFNVLLNNATDEMESALCAAIKERQRVRTQLQAELPDINQLKRTEIALRAQIETLLDVLGIAGRSAVSEDRLKRLQEEHTGIQFTISSAPAAPKSLLSQDEVKIYARRLMEIYRSALVAEPKDIKERLQHYLEPIQTEFEKRGSESMAILTSSIRFYSEHLGQDIYVPWRTVISAQMSRRGETRYSDDVLSTVRAKSALLSPLEICEILGIGRTTVSRWCKRGLPYSEVEGVHNRRYESMIRVAPADLASWIENQRESPSTFRFFPPNETFPKKPSVIQKRSKPKKLPEWITESDIFREKKAA